MTHKFISTLKVAGLVICVCLAVTNLHAQSASFITSTAKHFLKTLSADELKKTRYSFTDTTRLQWTNLPVGLVPRAGIQYGSLSDTSRIAFHQMLSVIFSSQGYLKLTSIMQLDDILNVLIKQGFESGKMNQDLYETLLNLKWAHANYYISIWGEPQTKEPWGFNFGGHHMALSITVKGNSISFSPLFMGTDPAEVRSGQYAGLRILSKEEDYGFMLLNFLSENQKKKAILSEKVPEDIITNPESSQRITTYYGISVKEFNKDQKAILEILLQEYIHNFEHSTAHVLYDKILKTGLDKIYFAWIGSTVKNKPCYYIINGPDFLIEYDNFQGNGNHIHLILREKDNDFGADLLKDHYLTNSHHKN